jgi:topoisomerase-4 subunit B
MTFFFREMPRLVENGHLFLALPPLYRLTQGDVTHYARDDAHREELLHSAFNGRGKVEISRFKGLGEMPARYLKATTMASAQRTLLRVTLPAKPDPAAIELPAEEFERTKALVETLMGRRPELRFDYIQKNARFARDLDV